MKKILTAALLLCGVVQAADLAGNSLVFYLNGKKFLLNGTARLGVENKSDGSHEIFIGGEDRTAGFEFTIRAITASDPAEGEILLDLSAHSVSVTLKSRRGDDFILLPEFQAAKTDAEGKKPEWAGKNREARKKDGRGLIRNSLMEGSAFQLYIRPVRENGRLTGYAGTFSGHAGVKARRKGKRSGGISDGEFKIGVSI